LASKTRLQLPAQAAGEVTAIFELKLGRLGTADLQALAYWVKGLRTGSKVPGEAFVSTPSPAIIVTIEGRLITCVTNPCLLERVCTAELMVHSVQNIACADSQ